jgi:hypothetical protein
MKITKERLKEIIKEELELAEQEQVVDDNEPGEAEKLASTKEAFSKKFLELSKSVRDVQGLDSMEMQLIANITLSLINYAGTATGAMKLKEIKAIVDKKIEA